MLLPQLPILRAFAFTKAPGIRGERSTINPPRLASPHNTTRMTTRAHELFLAA
jgi:hypothetical protein